MAKKGSPKLSIIIPTFNEGKRLGRHLLYFLNFPGLAGFPAEIIFVDDASGDNTVELLRAVVGGCKSCRIICLSAHRGKGAAVREGMLTAQGEFRLFADADNSTPIEQALSLLSTAEEGYEVVVGSRYVAGSQILRSQPWWRVWGGRFLNLLIQLILLWGVRDTQCGFKLFTAEAAQQIFSRLTLPGFSFDIEALALARHLGYRIKEVPVKWRDEPRGLVKPWRDGVLFIRDLIKVRLSLLSGRYQ